MFTEWKQKFISVTKLEKKKKRRKPLAKNVFRWSVCCRRMEYQRCGSSATKSVHISMAEHFYCVG